MDKITIPIGHYPYYYRGQLLLEDDFLAEQQYHVDARRQHTLHLHGWGVVHGLTVSRAHDTSCLIQAGVAIDSSGQEICLEQAQQISLAAFGPHARLQVRLGYEHGTGIEGHAGASPNRRTLYAVITVSAMAEDGAGVILACVHLDEQGHVHDQAIAYDQTRYARIVAPGSITPTELHEHLRKGWLCSPFRPVPLANPPPGETAIPPAFRVGATEVITPDPDEARERDRGAAGTMAILIPPSVRHITRLRIAGVQNAGGIDLQLIIGGWDQRTHEHVHKVVVEAQITAAPFLETFALDETALDPEYHTLSLWLHARRRASLSLIAIEFGY